MQSMTMTLSRRCMYAKLHVIWSKSLLYIFSLINHIDSLRIQALFLNSRHCTFIFLCFFVLFAFYSFVSNSHFLVVIRVFFKYSNVAILSILIMNSVNIVSVFLSWELSRVFKLNYWVKLLNSTWVLEFNFSIQFNTFSKKIQLNLNSSTQLDAISLYRSLMCKTWLNALMIFKLSMNTTYLILQLHIMWIWSTSKFNVEITNHLHFAFI